MKTDPTDHGKRWEIIAAFVFGCIFLTVILIINLYNPNPTPSQYRTFQITISLAAAGIGAVLPGFLDIRFKDWLRAGGALALFVFIYKVAPVAIPGPGPGGDLGPPPTINAKIKAEEWLLLVDQNDYKAAYALMSTRFKQNYPPDQVEGFLMHERKGLGHITSRQLYSSSPYSSPPGAPKGYYSQYTYKAVFQNEPKSIYETIWLFGEDNDWKVSGFFTSVKNDAGQFVPYDPK